MKQIIFLFMFSLLLTGCGSETDIEKENPELKGPLEVIIDNMPYNFHPKDVEAYITDNNEIRVSIVYAKTTEINYGLGFIFKENNLSEVVIVYIKNGKNYTTAHFNPSGTFQIKNYKYDPSTKNLYFEYEGKLFEKLPDVDLTASSITVKGKIDQKNISIRVEPARYSQIVTFNYQNNTFYPIVYLSSKSQEDDHIFHYDFIANDGDRIRFSVDPFVLSPASFPKQYTFNTNSVKNNITFYKFEGEPRATLQHILRNEDWKKYSSSGSFTITERTDLISKGTFTLEVYDNDNLLFKTEDGHFVL